MTVSKLRLSMWYQTLLCDALSLKRTRPGTQKQDKILILFMPYPAKIRIFVSCFVSGLFSGGGSLQTPISQRIREEDTSKLGNCNGLVNNTQEQLIEWFKFEPPYGHCDAILRTIRYYFIVRVMLSSTEYRGQLTNYQRNLMSRQGMGGGGGEEKGMVFSDE